MISSNDQPASPSVEGCGSPAGGQRKWRLTLLHWAVLLLVAVLETRMMWAPALLAGHSAWIDCIRMVEFDAAIRAGDYFPVWSPDLYYGYGSPLFQFYAPLAYYLAEIPMLAGAGVATSLKITQLLALWGSGLGMYHLTARHASRWIACLGGVLYMAAPYRFVDMFIRHALAEHCAFLWLPLIALGIDSWVAKRSSWGWVIAALASAGVILTHNIMALIGLPVAVLAGWVLGTEKRWSRSLLLAGWSAVAGVGLAAFFWWPALTGRASVCAEESLTGGYFDFHHHFVNAVSFFDPSWGFGESGIQSKVKMPVQIGLPHLALATGALGWLVMKGRKIGWGNRHVRLALAGVGTMSLGVFMCHQVSSPFWETLPLVKYAQFPWRFLALVVFGAAIAGVAVVDHWVADRQRLELPVFCGGVIMILATYFSYFSDVRFLAVDTKNFALGQVTMEQLESLESAGALVPLEKLLSLDAIRGAGERTTISDDFLPRGVREKPTEVWRQPALVNSGEIRSFERPGFNRYRVSVEMTSDGQVALQQFYFPGWEASVDGRQVEVVALGLRGLVLCGVPAGAHVVEFNYAGPPSRRVGLGISIASLVLGAVSLLAWKKMMRPCIKLETV